MTDKEDRCSVHTRWIRFYCRRLTFNRLIYVIIYTVCLLVVLFIKDKCDVERLRTALESKRQKGGTIDSSQITTFGHGFQIQISKQQANHAPSDNISPASMETTKSGFSNSLTIAPYRVTTPMKNTVGDYRKLTEAEKGDILTRVQDWFMIRNEFDKDPLLNKHQYIFHQTSKMCDRNIDLLILVHSAVTNVDRRRNIRSTWGSVHNFKNVSIGTVFLLGESVDTELNTNIAEEASANRDIVQGNFLDSYKNLTYKHVMALHWITSQCHDVRTVLKVDDDIVIDIFKLASFSKTVGHYENTLYCSPFRRGLAIRDQRDKWYTPPEVYPFDIYPDYCEGFGYIMSSTEARLMYRASEVMRFYWVDDVYVTGLLARKAGIKIKSLALQHGYIKQNRFVDLSKTDLMFYLNYDNWQDVWMKILSRKYRY